MIPRHSARRFADRAATVTSAVACLSMLVAFPAAGLDVRFAPDVIRAPWHRGEALVIPAVEPLDLDRAHEQGPPAALALSRFLLHAEAGPFAEYLFPALTDAIRPAQYGAEAQLAHDGTHLYLWARMALPPRKQVSPEGLAYGVWPGRDEEGSFDNTEFVMLAADDGTARRVARRVYFVDWRGMVLHRRYQDWAGLEPLEPEERTGEMEARCTWEGDHWRLTARVPVEQILPDVEDLQRPLRLNVARVTGWPAEGIPVRAASLSATFLAQNVFPAFRLGDAPAPVQAAGFSYGHVTAWHTYPRGEQEAQVADEAGPCRCPAPARRIADPLPL